MQSSKRFVEPRFGACIDGWRSLGLDLKSTVGTVLIVPGEYRELRLLVVSGLGCLGNPDAPLRIGRCAGALDSPRIFQHSYM